MKHDPEVIDGRWKVKDELDYSGPTRTPKEELALAGQRLLNLIVWGVTAVLVFGVVSCAKLIGSAAGF